MCDVEMAFDMFGGRICGHAAEEDDELAAEGE